MCGVPLHEYCTLFIHSPLSVRLHCYRFMMGWLKLPWTLLYFFGRHSWVVRVHICQLGRYKHEWGNRRVINNLFRGAWKNCLLWFQILKNLNEILPVTKMYWLPLTVRSTEGVLITKAEAAMILQCGTKARLLWICSGGAHRKSDCTWPTGCQNNKKNKCSFLSHFKIGNF